MSTNIDRSWPNARPISDITINQSKVASPTVKQLTGQWLRVEKLSPELIIGRWKEGIAGVSHETLCQWIWIAKAQNDPDNKDLYMNRKHGRRRRKRGNYNDSRGVLSNRISIEQRPEIAIKSE